MINVNMNKLVFFAVLAVIISSAQCHSTEKVLDKVKSRHVRKYLSQNREHIDRRFDNFEKECPGGGDKLKSAVVSSQECIEHISDSLTMCESIQAHTLNCSAPVNKVISDCLPEKSKSLPTFMTRSFLSVWDCLCHERGEQIFELANPCFWADPERQPNEKLLQCEDEARLQAEKFNKFESLPSQTELCSFLTEIEDCVHIRVTYCKNRRTKEAFTRAYEAMLQPCQEK